MFGKPYRHQGISPSFSLLADSSHSTGFSKSFSFPHFFHPLYSSRCSSFLGVIYLFIIFIFFASLYFIEIVEI
ncbi:hypothetical protein CDL12_01752 [Handroanthus impetiginosus]|uniref:Uncharacterized protein n=1 Tax=Handroanthus impetiginosus TaxID=429701 RepID=A0A2G9I782_9LAMI|nr:hypothetical protein CDL12_01752 [Handroanthus impetiginosus]